MNNCIYLDIGNSNAKWKYKGKYFEVPTTEFNIEDLPESSKIWISNVFADFKFSNKSNISLVESQKSYKSLINSYKKPHMLGSDRWLSMIASYEMNPDKSFILIDIGTAITIDVVNNSGLHLGGVIFPGLEKIRQSFDFPLLSLDGNSNKIGQSTDEAWTIGTRSVIVNTINHKVREFKEELQNSSIILTGGGYLGIHDYLDFDHNYYENLVLDGLEFFANNMG